MRGTHRQRWKLDSGGGMWPWLPAFTRSIQNATNNNKKKGSHGTHVQTRKHRLPPTENRELACVSLSPCSVRQSASRLPSGGEAFPVRRTSRVLYSSDDTVYGYLSAIPR